MIGYVLLTYGAKPSSDLIKHPAARQQMRNLRSYNSIADIKIRGVFFEYRRKIRDGADLPKLVGQLQMFEKQRSGIVLIDDVGRILRSCPKDDLIDFYAGMGNLWRCLFSLKHGQRVSDIPMQKLTQLLDERGPQRFRLPFGDAKPPVGPDSRLQTEDARFASINSRSQAADEKAFELEIVRNGLTENGDKATCAAIADEANRKGMLTTRGGPWRGSSVARVIARVQRPGVKERFEIWRENRIKNIKSPETG